MVITRDREEQGTPGGTRIEHTPGPHPESRELSGFDNRYGTGAYDRLTTLLRQPCVTFAEIAEQFGVSRECVRQWHRQFLPDAPSGHQRQRLCAVYHQRRRLFEDELFRTFFRHARAHSNARRIDPISVRGGYRTRAVLMDKQVIALRDVSHVTVSDIASGRRLGSLFRYRGTAGFVYFKLASPDFIFLPAGTLLTPHAGPDDEPLSSCVPFLNTFRALREKAEGTPRPDSQSMRVEARVSGLTD